MVYFKVDGGRFDGGDITNGTNGGEYGSRHLTTPAKYGLKHAEDICSQYSQCNAVSHGDNESEYWLKHIQSSNPGYVQSDFNSYVNMNKVGNHLVFRKLKTNHYY